MKRHNPVLGIILATVGALVSVVPPVIAVLTYFPIWVAEGGESVLPGFTAFLLVIAALPLYRLMKRFLASPSAWVMWLIAFVLFLLLSRVADEMTVISFVGLVSNIISALIFKYRRSIVEDEGER